MTDIVTADGAVLHEGDRAFNYYDMRIGRIGRIDSRPQPDTMKGQNSSTPIEEWSNYWFDFVSDSGGSTSLDGSRICTVECARRKGWVE
jgi:hypothetical protein